MRVNSGYMDSQGINTVVKSVLLKRGYKRSKNI